MRLHDIFICARSWSRPTRVPERFKVSSHATWAKQSRVMYMNADARCPNEAAIDRATMQVASHKRGIDTAILLHRTGQREGVLSWNSRCLIEILGHRIQSQSLPGDRREMRTRYQLWRMLPELNATQAQSGAQSTTHNSNSHRGHEALANGDGNRGPMISHDDRWSRNAENKQHRALSLFQCEHMRRQHWLRTRIIDVRP